MEEDLNVSFNDLSQVATTQNVVSHCMWTTGDGLNVTSQEVQDFKFIPQTFNKTAEYPTQSECSLSVNDAVTTGDAVHVNSRDAQDNITGHLGVTVAMHGVCATGAGSCANRDNSAMNKPAGNPRQIEFGLGIDHGMINVHVNSRDAQDNITSHLGVTVAKHGVCATGAGS